MAATLQQQQQHATNPQLKRLVYSKYRELLGSYNDKANTIIQALPAYMVTEDKGFNFEVKNSNDADRDEVDYSVPLPPTLPSNGSLPARRLQTQAPPCEPPACVQNAMMTKDKKPFTYTPGGIDLSQIKSPRMAKRIARNAQHEGVTNQPKTSPLAQDQQNSFGGGYSPPAAPPPPASAMGVPVQVFPAGPSPPPPPAPPSSFSNVPPPPPPMSSSQLAPQSNGREARKSPTPQNFEPPPMGCRPEIKIPANPMASLRKVPKPEPKNEFWVEEYRKERSKSPMPGEDSKQAQSANQPARQEAPPRVSSPSTNKPQPIFEDDSDPRKDPNRIAFQQQRPQPMQHAAQPQQQRQIQPNVQSVPMSVQDQAYPPHMDPNRIAFQQQRQPQQREVSPVRTPAGPYQQYQRPQQSAALATNQRVDSPFRPQDHPNLQRPLSPVRAQNSPNVQQQSSQPVYYMRQSQPQQQQPPNQQQQLRQNVISPPPQQKPTQVGSLYIAPVSPENLATGGPDQPRSAGLQQTPPWLSQRSNTKENPEWMREVNTPPAANRTQTPPFNTNQPNSGPGLRLQMTPNAAASTNPKERIIPIQMEKTPTPSRTPSTPGFGPQPYSPNSQQYGSVSSPGSGYSSPNVAAMRNPNQFVDQGYNNFPNQQQQQAVIQQRVMSPPVQQGGGRIIPIAIERDDGPFSPTTVRGPISPTPMVIQNENYRLVVYDCPLEAQLRFGKGRLSDPRGIQQSRSNGIPPNQSKSFRVLQRITDTEGAQDSDSDQPVELHGPQYSRQMGSSETTTDQMRRMQINDSNQQTFVNRGPIQRQTQGYVQQRPIFPQNDQPQQYVHPSEQQVHEPKIYTGAAIPSRSFKILQAMTTPENAVEMEDSGVVESQTNYCNPCYSFPYPGRYRQSPTFLPYYIPDPNDPTWQSQNDHPFYQPFCYYYPQYDVEGNGDYGNGFDDHDIQPIKGAPNIIITASPDDDQEEVHSTAIQNEIVSCYQNGNARGEDGLKMSKDPERLGQISRSANGNEKEENEDLSNKNNDHLPASKSSPVHLFPSKSPENENASEDESDDLFTSSSSSSEEYVKGKIHDSSDGLHAIKSVTDIKVYDVFDNKHKNMGDSQDVTQNQESFRNNLNSENDTKRFSIVECDDEEDSSSDELCDEELEEGIVDSDSETNDANDIGSEVAEQIEIKQQLSVIYEEDGVESVERRHKRRTESINSTSSTLSECSTTIANDDGDEDEEESDQEDSDENEGDDDEENSVTVRLPLRLSFSRSSNDENITTVVVGDSEIHDSRRSSLKSIDDRIECDFNSFKDKGSDDNGNDISVTFSLASRSNSGDRSGLLSKTSSVDQETSVKDWDDSDSESISVSISLPLKRNKFMMKTLNDDNLTNDIHDIKSAWDEQETEETVKYGVRGEKRTNDEVCDESIPKTIDEEEEDVEEEDSDEADELSEDEEEEDEDESEQSSELEKVFKVQANVTAEKEEIEEGVFNSKPITTTHPRLFENTTEMIESLRELRVWNENVWKRLTEEREIGLNKRLGDASLEEPSTESFGKRNDRNTKETEPEQDKKDYKNSDDLCNRNSNLKSENSPNDSTEMIDSLRELRVWDEKVWKRLTEDREIKPNVAANERDTSLDEQKIGRFGENNIQNTEEREPEQDKKDYADLDNLSSNNGNLKNKSNSKGSNEMIESLRELRVWNEKAWKRLTEDREIKPKSTAHKRLSDASLEEQIMGHFEASNVENVKKNEPEHKRNYHGSGNLFSSNSNLKNENKLKDTSEMVDALRELRAWSESARRRLTEEREMTPKPIIRKRFSDASLEEQNLILFGESNEQIQKTSEKDIQSYGQATDKLSVGNTNAENEDNTKTSNEMLETLRELRVWTENARKRMTEDRELEQKPVAQKRFSDATLEEQATAPLVDLTDEYVKPYSIPKDLEDDQASDDDSDTLSSSSASENNVEDTTKTTSDSQPPKSSYLNPLEESLSYVFEETRRKCEEVFNNNTNNRPDDNAKMSVRDRIAAFEAPKDTFDRSKTPKPIIEIANNNTLVKKEILNRNSSIQRSESELDEDDSGVTSDMSKPVSETDTDPECFTELRKMSRYQRASTHSRLFKLLQEEKSFDEENKKTNEEEKPPAVVLRPKKKIIHNVSITRRSNPEALQQAETMSQRRERLSLPLKISNSIDADNLSTSNSPSSPTQLGGVSEQLVTELVQSLLLKKNSGHLRDLPLSKLQAAARKVLQDDLDIDSLENTSIESTPALTPQDIKKEYQKSYSEYYDSWDRSNSPRTATDQSDFDIIPSRTFRNLYNQSPLPGQNKYRPVRCPRVLSSKTVNRDLSRLTESCEPNCPESYRSSRSSATPEKSREYLRATSVSRIGKV